MEALQNHKKIEKSINMLDNVISVRGKCEKLILKAQ